MRQRNNGRMEKITFVIPSRNNLEFLQLAYKSIRDLETKHEILVLNDTIYAATEKGLYKAAETNPFLNDFNSWSVITNLPVFNGEYNAIVHANGKLLTNFKGDGVTSNDTVYSFDGTVS